MSDGDDWGGDGDGGDDWGDDDGGGDDWGDDGGDDWGDGGGGGDDNMGGDADSWEIQVENLYYTAEPDIKADPKCALENFLKCIKLEEENSADIIKFRFNALKHVVMLLFNLRDIDMLQCPWIQ